MLQVVQEGSGATHGVATFEHRRRGYPAQLHRIGDGCVALTQEFAPARQCALQLLAECHDGSR